MKYFIKFTQIYNMYKLFLDIYKISTLFKKNDLGKI